MLPDICFAVNLLARFSFSPIKGHWNGVEHMIEYPRRTIVMGLFYPEESKTKLFDYADAEYLSDPHKALSQARYVFACGGTIISWRSMKQMLLCRNKSPPWSKSKVHLVEINDTSYSRNVWSYFEKEYTNHNVRRLETSSQEIKWCVQYVLHSFSLDRGFFPLGFPGKVFNEATNGAYQKICVLFFLHWNFFPQGFS